MLGTQSGLHLHEWSKHGSCYEDYLSSAGIAARSKTAPCYERAGFGQISTLISLNRQAIRLNQDENLPQTSTLSRRHLFLNGLIGSDADEYFLDTMHVLEQLNASAVRELFVKKLGQTVSFDEVQAAFDTAFGPGSGQRVVMRCSGVGGVNVLTELWIGLAGEIGPESQLSDLILNAPTTENSTHATSCRRGLVVEVAP